MATEYEPYTFEQFDEATGNHPRAKVWWHAAVQQLPEQYNITRRNALQVTLTAAQIATAATIGAQRLGLLRSEYTVFVEAVNAMPPPQRKRR